MVRRLTARRLGAELLVAVCLSTAAYRAATAEPPDAVAGTPAAAGDPVETARAPAEEGSAPAAARPAGTVEVTAEPVEATVGDQVTVRVVVTVPSAARLETSDLGPQLGPFAVTEGSWNGPETVDGLRRWTWTGQLVSFRTGEFEIPALRVKIVGEDGSESSASSKPLPVTVVSVLDDADADAAAEIADLKPPASIEPDYGPLITGVIVLGALLLGAGLLWWLHRRYAARLAAVPAPEDPFHRTPPHEWVYAELQKLLERRLAENGQVVEFFSELSRILKRYLGGRYRVELMEQTTEEVPGRLRQAGAELDAIGDVRSLLERCDLIKFAKAAPEADACRAAIETAYRIVDATKPRGEAVRQGVA